MLCLISAQIRLLTINHVREFCYSFDQAYNPLSRGFFKQKGSSERQLPGKLCADINRSEINCPFEFLAYG